MKILKNAVKSCFSKIGYKISRSSAGDSPIDHPSFAGAGDRLALRKPCFASVIDVGAAIGAWSDDLASKFPGRHHLLIEANEVHHPVLEQKCRKHRTWSYVMKACGQTTGSIFFDGRDPFGGQARMLPDNEARSTVPMTTIDHEVSLHNLEPPFLIKLDTHGFEIPILIGAETTLAETEVLVIECYNFIIGKEAVRFWAMCEWLASRGFLPIDMFDVLYRPSDHSLWQMDIVFMRSSRPEFQNAAYR